MCWRSGWDKLPAFASDDDDFDAKHCEWPEGNNPTLKNGSDLKPTMYLASLDIKRLLMKQNRSMWHKILTAARHGWLIAAFLREDVGAGRQGHVVKPWRAVFFNRCLRQGSVEAPHLCGRKWPLSFWLMRKKKN